MIDQTHRYLHLIGATEVTRARVNQFTEVYRSLGIPDFDRIFVSDTVKEDGSRELGSLWLIAVNLVAEVADFLTAPKFDFVRYDRQVVHWQVEASSYDFREALPESRLKLNARFASSLSLEMTATAANCDELWSILRTYLVPQALETVVPPMATTIL